MVIDTSAVIAIFHNEVERDQFLASIHADARRLMSAATLLETRMVLRRLFDEDGLSRLQRFLDSFGIEVVSFDEAQSILASEAFRRFGKGRHPARLNLGDCFSYALAKQTGEPLLFKGDDFSQTDLRIA